MASPTARSLDSLRKQGMTVATVERWNAFAKIRQDVYGWMDLLAMDGKAIYGIQVTSDTNRSARREKILAEPRAKKWVESGGKILLHTWGKHGDRGKRKTWELHSEDITIINFI